MIRPARSAGSSRMRARPRAASSPSPGRSMAAGRPFSAARDSSREGAPRLVLRFAVVTAAALALAAAAILLVVRHFDTVQAERAATSRARVIATAVLTGSLLAT